MSFLLIMLYYRIDQGTISDATFHHSDLLIEVIHQMTASKGVPLIAPLPELRRPFFEVRTAAKLQDSNIHSWPVILNASALRQSKKERLRVIDLS